MKVEYQDHYDEKYWTFSKEYRKQDGSVHKYTNPSLEWGGFDEIHKIMTGILPGQRVLDIGCGGGALSSRFLAEGRDVYGVDVSQYAIDNCLPAMRGRILQADITTQPELAPLPSSYDLILSTDLMEHIYEEDLGSTFLWMKSILKPRGLMFLLVATLKTLEEKPYSLRKGQKVPLALEEAAVSGHVNVRPWHYWIHFFREMQMTIRYDFMWVFSGEREYIPWMRQLPQWGSFCVYILEKP